MNHIIGPAIWLSKLNTNGGVLISGVIGQTHDDLSQYVSTENLTGAALGFVAIIDDCVKFVNRKEGASIAHRSGQIKSPVVELQSEDLIKN